MLGSVKLRSLIFLLIFAGALIGCKSPVPSVPVPRVELPKVEPAQQARAENAERDKYRQQMEQIPPPSKSRYVDVHSPDAWENPLIRVDADKVVLRVLRADANPSSLGTGGLLRPKGARRQELPLRIEDLSAAVTAIPASAWPYGRVIAITEASESDHKQQQQVRRNIEHAIQTLNDMGVVVDEWPSHE
jgi:hypothetical protein